MTVKQQILQAMEQLPEDADFEQAMEKLYLLFKVQRGIEQADTGRVVSQDEVERRVSEWLK